MTEAETKAALKEKSKPKVPIHVFHSRADAERAAAGKPVDVEAGDRMKVSMVLNPKQAARRGRERREREQQHRCPALPRFSSLQAFQAV